MTSAPAGQPGLQLERTSLAWNRTALTAAALGATTARTGITDRSVLDLIATAVSLVAALTMYACSRRRHPAHSSTGDIPAGRTAILIAAVSAAAATAAATVVLLVHAVSS